MEVARLQAKFETSGEDQVHRAVKAVHDDVTSLGNLSVATAKRIGDGFATAGNLIKVAFGAVVAGQAKQVVSGFLDAGSDLNESLSKNTAVFGEQVGKQIEAWANNSAEAIGIPKQAAIESAATFGNLFEGMGFVDQASADMSKRIVGLSADLGSFNNIPTAQVLEDIRSGIVGEAEPLRKYGILIDEATTQQKAMAMTGKTVASELTQQEKAAARYELILEQTTTAQGDFARTSKGAANASRIFNARLQDMRAELGRKLLPVQEKALDIANRFIDRFNDKRAMGLGVWAAAMSSLHTTLHQTFGQAAGDRIIGVIRGIGHAVDTVVGSFGKLASGDLSGFLQGIAGVARDTVALIPEVAIDIGKWVIGKAPDVWGWLKREVLELFGGTGTTSVPLPGIGGMSAVSVNRSVPIGEVGIQIKGWAVHTAVDLWERVKQKALGWFGGNATQIQGDGTGGPEPGSRSVPLGDVAVQIKDWTITTAVDLWERIKQRVRGWFGGGGESVGLAGIPIAGGLAMAAAEPIPLGQVAVKIGGWLVDQAEALGDAVSGKIGEWWPAVASGGQKLAGYALDLGGWAVQEGESIASAVANKFVDWWPDIKAAGVSLAGMTVKLTQWALEEGESLVTTAQEFVNTITGNLSWSNYTLTIGAPDSEDAINVDFEPILSALNNSFGVNVPDDRRAELDQAGYNFGYDVGGTFVDGVARGVEWAFKNGAGSGDGTGGGGSTWTLPGQDTVNGFFDGLFDAISDKLYDYPGKDRDFDKDRGFGLKVVDWVVSGVSKSFSGALDLGGDIWTGLKIDVEKLWGGLKDALMSAFDWSNTGPVDWYNLGGIGVRVETPGPFTAIENWISESWEGFKDFLGSFVPDIEIPQWLSDPIGWIKGKVSGAQSKLDINDILQQGVKDALAAGPQDPYAMEYDPIANPGFDAARMIAGPANPEDAVQFGPINLVADVKVLGADGTDFATFGKAQVTKAVADLKSGLFGGGAKGSGGGTSSADFLEFLATFKADTGPAAEAYSDVSLWGQTFAAQTFTAKFDIDHGLAAIKYTEAFGWGYTWAGMTFSARFSIDTSPLFAALDTVRFIAAEVAALMPHSPADKGPLREPISFGYIADDLARTMSRMPSLAAAGMAGVARNMGPDVGISVRNRARARSQSNGGGDTYFVIERGALVGQGAMAELQKLVASGAVKVVDQRLSNRGTSGRS